MKIIRKLDWLYVPKGYDFAALCTMTDRTLLIYSTEPFDSNELDGYVQWGIPPEDAKMGCLDSTDGWHYSAYYYEESMDVFEDSTSTASGMTTECERRPAGLPFSGLWLSDVPYKFTDLVFDVFNAMGAINVPSDDSYEPIGSYTVEPEFENPFQDVDAIAIVHDEFGMYAYPEALHFLNSDHITLSELLELASSFFESMENDNG